MNPNPKSPLFLHIPHAAASSPLPPGPTQHHPCVRAMLSCRRSLPMEERTDGRAVTRETDGHAGGHNVVCLHRRLMDVGLPVSTTSSLTRKETILVATLDGGARRIRSITCCSGERHDCAGMMQGRNARLAPPGVPASLRRERKNRGRLFFRVRVFGHGVGFVVLFWPRTISAVRSRGRSISMRGGSQAGGALLGSFWRWASAQVVDNP
jgi:hypothetical protein